MLLKYDRKMTVCWHSKRSLISIDRMELGYHRSPQLPYSVFWSLAPDHHAVHELAPIHEINLGFQNFIGSLLVGNSLTEESMDCWNWPISSRKSDWLIILVDSEKDGVLQSGIRDRSRPQRLLQRLFCRRSLPMRLSRMVCDGELRGWLELLLLCWLREKGEMGYWSWWSV